MYCEPSFGRFYQRRLHTENVFVEGNKGKKKPVMPGAADCQGPCLAHCGERVVWWRNVAMIALVTLGLSLWYHVMVYQRRRCVEPDHAE